MAQLPPVFRLKYWNSSGTPLAGGKLYSYAAGTSTPQATYTDSTGATPNPNPLILDANGEGVAWLGTSAYKFVLKDSLDVTQWTIDNVDYLPDGSVSTAKLADGSVTTAKLAANAVTPAKLAALNLVTSALTIPSTSSTSAVAATGSVTISTTGRPVKVGLVGDYSAAPAFFKVSGLSSIPMTGTIELFRDATRILSQSFGVVKTNGGTVAHSYTAGTYTFTPAEAGVVMIEGCGGGGGGGGGSDDNPGAIGSGGAGGGGGGGSAFSNRMIDLSSHVGAAITIVVGAAGTGGSGGAGGATSGTNGGDTTLTVGGTTIVKFTGGAGGGRATGYSVQGAGGQGFGMGGSGGAGGPGATTSVGVSGNNSQFDGLYTGGAAGAGSGTGGSGGGGGGGFNGAGGAGGNKGAPSQAGSNGAGYGAGGGGGGGASTGSGSNGGNGVGGILNIYDGGSLFGGNSAAYASPSAFSTIDSGASAAVHSYTMKYYVSDASATLSASGTISLQAYEL